MDKLLHTPEGVRDIYNGECKKKLALQEKLHKTMHCYGYQDIQTPTFEFHEVFNLEKGTIDPKEMYRFVDRDGNLLVIRPDITPSIARAVARYYPDSNVTLRLCYLGNTFRNNASYQGKLKENTQIGAELIGADSATADGEILALAITSILAAGITDFQLAIGHVDFFKGLVEEANLSEDTQQILKELIENKNYFGIEDLLPNGGALTKLPELAGAIEVLKKARQLTNNEKALHALTRLQETYHVVQLYGLERYITFDLGMVNELNYYTGIIFSGYTYGTGTPIVNGGRYDSLLPQFGKSAASVGFAVVIDELMTAMDRQKLQIPIEHSGTYILYEEGQLEKGIMLARDLRSDGHEVELELRSKMETLDTYFSYAKLKGMGGIIHIDEMGALQVIDIVREMKLEGAEL